MTTALPIKGLDLETNWAELEKASSDRYVAAAEKSSPNLVSSIKSGAVTLEQIESFLLQAEQVPANLKAILLEYLLRLKAGHLLRLDRWAEALAQCDAALEVNREAPETWVLKGTVLLGLERYDEATQAFQKAYSHREGFGDRQKKSLPPLFKAWSGGALLWGLKGVLQEDIRELQRGTEAYLEALEKAENEKMLRSVLKPLAEPDTELDADQLADALEELKLTIHLLSIKDPFEGWGALSKEVARSGPRESRQSRPSASNATVNGTAGHRCQRSG
ncbi:MAG: hypothetical protein ACE5Q6_03265 [Dehalococcoidia bacterium]